jgi:hypothetical protein
MLESHPLSPIFFGILVLVFLGILSYMFLYNKRSKERQRSLEAHGHPMASKEAGILEAQEAMKHDRQQHHR